MIEPVLDRLCSVRNAFRKFDQFPVQVCTGRIGVFRRNSSLNVGGHGGICPTCFIEVHDCKSHDCDFFRLFDCCCFARKGRIVFAAQSRAEGFPKGRSPLAYWGIFSDGIPVALRKCPNKLWLFQKPCGWCGWICFRGGGWRSDMGCGVFSRKVGVPCPERSPIISQDREPPTSFQLWGHRPACPRRTNFCQQNLPRSLRLAEFVRQRFGFGSAEVSFPVRNG